jgi:hypothetical protein
MLVVAANKTTSAPFACVHHQDPNDFLVVIDSVAHASRISANLSHHVVVLSVGLHSKTFNNSSKNPSEQC